MNYELAKQLKDAGYSQQIGRGYYIPGELLLGGVERVYIPTLSELIAACGKFDFVLHYLEHEQKWQTSIQIPVPPDGEVGAYDQLEYYTDGSTPEEAVAQLFLVLKRDPQVPKVIHRLRELGDYLD